MKKAVLVYLVKKNKVLLGFKKRGFGEGRWNGVGGKLEKGETSKKAAIRETKEEIGIEIKSLELVAKLRFIFPEKSEKQVYNQDVDVFIVTEWEGGIIETEEIKPEWFKINNLLFEDMWEDDRYWLERVLKGERLECEFYFDDNERIVKNKINVLKLINL